jgi:hypothetical protein
VELEKRPMQMHLTLSSWCKKNGYGGVTEECILNAFNSDDPKVQGLAKKEKLKNIAKKG